MLKNRFITSYKSVFLVICSLSSLTFLIGCGGGSRQSSPNTNNTPAVRTTAINPENGKMIMGEAGNFYIANPDGTDKVYLMRADQGSEFVWSPDGKKIAFTSARKHENGDTFVMNADGSNQKNITNNPSHKGLHFWLSNNRIIYSEIVPDNTMRLGAKHTLYSVDIESKEKTSLTDAWGMEFGAIYAVSPDGKKVALTRIVKTPDSPNGEQYVMTVLNTDGTERRDFPLCTPSSWSADSKKLMYSTGSSGYVMDTSKDISSPIPLIDGPVQGSLLLSPDGNSVAYLKSKPNVAYEPYIHHLAFLEVLNLEDKTVKSISLGQAVFYGAFWVPGKQSISYWTIPPYENGMSGEEYDAIAMYPKMHTVQISDLK
jgi:WD40-like Beta Propeller Repeat